MSFAWSHRATKALLCLCEKEYWQNPSQEGKKDRISKSMKIMGYPVSPAQCQEKLDSLIRSCKQIPEGGGKSKGKMPDIPFFKEIQNIIHLSEESVLSLIPTSLSQRSAGFSKEQCKVKKDLKVAPTTDHHQQQCMKKKACGTIETNGTSTGHQQISSIHQQKCHREKEDTEQKSPFKAAIDHQQESSQKEATHHDWKHEEKDVTDHQQKYVQQETIHHQQKHPQKKATERKSPQKEITDHQQKYLPQETIHHQQEHPQKEATEQKSPQKEMTDYQQKYLPQETVHHHQKHPQKEATEQKSPQKEMTDYQQKCLQKEATYLRQKCSQGESTDDERKYKKKQAPDHHQQKEVDNAITNCQPNSDLINDGHEKQDGIIPEIVENKTSANLHEEEEGRVEVDADSSVNGTDESSRGSDSSKGKKRVNPFSDPTKDLLKLWREAVAGQKYASVSQLVLTRLGKSMRELGHEHTDSQYIAKMYYLIKRYKQVCEKKSSQEKDSEKKEFIQDMSFIYSSMYNETEHRAPNRKAKESKAQAHEMSFETVTGENEGTLSDKADSKRNITAKAKPMRYFKWNDNSVVLLLKVWEKIVKSHLGESKYCLSTKDYQEMSQTLRRKGYEVSYKRCEDKVQYLVQWYNELPNKKSHRAQLKSENHRRLFDKLESILLMKNTKVNTSGYIFKPNYRNYDRSFPRTPTFKDSYPRNASLWSEDATLELISLWEKYYIQYKGSTIPHDDFKIIAQSMKEMGHDFTEAQCKSKIYNLIFLYKKYLKKPSKRVKRQQIYYKRIGDVLGDVLGSAMESSNGVSSSGDEQVDDLDKKKDEAQDEKNEGKETDDEEDYPEDEEIDWGHSTGCEQESVSEGNVLTKVNQVVIQRKRSLKEAMKDFDEFEHSTEEQTPKRKRLKLQETDRQGAKSKRCVQRPKYLIEERNQHSGKGKRGGAEHRPTMRKKQPVQVIVKEYEHQVGSETNTLEQEVSEKMTEVSKGNEMDHLETLMEMSGDETDSSSTECPVLSRCNRDPMLDGSFIQQIGVPDFSCKRVAMNNNVLELMQRLQEESEAREDARQQRLLEHERRMEERLRCWENRWKEKEMKWQEERRQYWEIQQREESLRGQYGVDCTDQYQYCMQRGETSVKKELQDLKRMCQKLYFSVERLEQKIVRSPEREDYSF